MAKDQLEIDRDAAIAAAEEVYNGAIAVAEANRDAAYDSIEAENRAAQKANSADCQKAIFSWCRKCDEESMTKGFSSKREKARLDGEDRIRREYEAREEAIDEKYKADNKAAEAAYSAACDAAYNAYVGACDAAHAEYKRLWDDRQAAEEERRRKEEAKRAQAARKAEEERKLIAGPAVTVTVYQAAARLGLTMKEFWAHVVSGKYPEPRDDNTYDRDTIDRLPRPKVVRRKPIKMMASNIFTDIVKF